MTMAAAAGCTGAKTVTHPAPTPRVHLSFDFHQKAQPVRRVGGSRMPGAISDLEMSDGGKAILVATAPDHDIAGSADKYLLTRVKPDGKIAWRKVLKGQVKSQTISADGSLIVVTDYENHVTAYNAGGHRLWSAEGTCKPIVFNQQRKVLCYHDDDAEPDVAFDIFDFQGKVVSSFPIQDDILSLKISEDQHNIAFALAGGVAILAGPDFKQIWMKKLGGEILDISVSPGGTPKVAVLYHVPSGEQKIALLGADGTMFAEGVPAAHAQQIELSPDGSMIFAYGNGVEGQYLGAFEVPATGAVPAAPPAALKEKWMHGLAQAADYSSSIIAGKDFVLMGLEDIGEDDRDSHLVGFDFAGNLRWNIIVKSDEGAYLYSQGFSEDRALLAVGSDDGTLNLYHLTQ
ncbi:MAG: outer membrane protein assembly factor BamB family protein [Bdellovibrionota bacterium]